MPIVCTGACVNNILPILFLVGRWAFLLVVSDWNGHCPPYWFVEIAHNH